MGGSRKKITPRKNNGDRGKRLSPQKVIVRDHNVQCQRNLLHKEGDAVIPDKSKEGKHFIWGDESLPPNLVSRPTVSHKIVKHIHRGGKITFHSTMSYVGGAVKSIEGWDTDEISSIEVGKLVKALGYLKRKSLWYRPPNLDGFAIRPLNCDEEVRKLCTDLKGHGEVDVFVEHVVEACVSETVLEIVDKFYESDGDVEIIDIPEILIQKDKSVQGDPKIEVLTESGKGVQVDKEQVV